MHKNTIIEKTICTHCGDPCSEATVIESQGKSFCCNGCKIVYDVISSNGMDAYYQLSSSPGMKQKSFTDETFEYLDDDEIVHKLLQFREEGKSRVQFTLPQIHCSSCLWLLENLSVFHKGISLTHVQFSRKSATIIFDESLISLRQVVELLHSIGYKPDLSLKDLKEKKKTSSQDKTLYYQLGLAGFCFGNIMLLSFPEYLGLKQDVAFVFISYLNIFLATPVLLYCAKDYLVSAFNALKYKTINIDVPIAIGILTLYGRSVYEILSHTGVGYLDSFTGFIFFLLIGKWFQSFTFQSLDFERNYSSYLPISVQVKKDNNELVTVSLDKLRTGDTIIIKNEQIVPADAILMKGDARIDYSFVTGEADPIKKNNGEKILAGGKQMGGVLELLLTKEVTNSYLTQLWNDDIFRQKIEADQSILMKKISAYFIYIILSIAAATLIYWLIVDKTVAFNAFTAVLIVACPCVLALSIPFTYGNIIRLLAKSNLFLQNVETIETLQDIDSIVFDKTGTITSSDSIEVSYTGKTFTPTQASYIKSLTYYSDHPLSQAIFNYLHNNEIVPIDNFNEIQGMGLSCTIDGIPIKIGSHNFIFHTDEQDNGTVGVEIKGEYIGTFQFKHAFRKSVQSLFPELSKQYDLHVLSGDNEKDYDRISTLVSAENMKFNQSPMEKLQYIKSLQNRGERVLMIGDGLNDAGALKQSNIGLVLSDNNLNFTPSSNGILQADMLFILDKILHYIRASKKVIYGALGLSVLYNGIGLYFAVMGKLSPVIAAILMPISSLSIVLYGVLSSYLLYRFIVHRHIS